MVAALTVLPGGTSDEFLVIKDETLLPMHCSEPAEYVGVDPRTLDRPSTVDDICDFFLEYMQSDVVVRLCLSFLCTIVTAPDA